MNEADARISIGGVILCLSIIVSWMFGIVLAPGWMKLVAVCFVPYGWYLLAERVAQIIGLSQ